MAYKKRMWGLKSSLFFLIAKLCKKKIQTYGTILQRLIRDERFFIGLEPEDDNFWLPAQLLRSTNGISCTSSEETIVNVLRLFLSMACSSNVTLNGRLLIEVLSRCGEFWEYGTRSVKASSLAAASQCLRTFCSFLKDEADELKQSAPACSNLLATSTVYNEVIPVMQWLCSKLIEPGNNSTPKKQHSTLFFIESILTLVSSLPNDVHSSPHFTAFLWKTFCPNLAASLGSPGRVNFDKKFSYKDAIHIIESENRGFFVNRPGLDGAEARCVYLTAIQLLRIAGAQGSLRPVLEALFHRMLLLPLPQNRSEPLRCVRDAFKNPQRLIELSVIMHYDKNQSVSDDMELFRLIIDSMEECAISSNSAFGSDDSLHSSIECLVALLSSLQALCTGDIENVMSDNVAEVVNQRYANLKDADYHGPLTYQSLIRLPREYRDAVAELKATFEPSDSDNEELARNNPEGDQLSNGSGETEGPEDGDSSDEQSRAEANWLYSNFSEPKIDGESDRKHAKEFAKILKAQLVPKLLKLNNSIEIDSEIQEFSSNICHQNSMNVSDFDYNLTAINADGIYLATYSTLLLSLQLMRAGHYDKTDVSFLLINHYLLKSFFLNKF
jgi:brefeldin A-inhibited guanine nucleotide-exchange protein 3